ncbi:MAG: phosphate/phosphite/phosphonate ABC transporter substrate-binding protein [Candidatus Thiodiazotropha sp.]|jgi:ABC-type phosphate/phosphonate transport system substrate-binding protein
MSGKMFRLALMLACLFAFAPHTYSADLKLGVLAPRGELKASARWQAFAEYLSDALGKTVVLVPLPPAQVLGAADSGKIDYLLSHSPHTVYVQEKQGAKVLATLNTQAGPRFGGVIIAKKGSGITTAEDLRGKRVMSLKFKAAAGAYIFQTYHLTQKGLDPHRDFASLREGKKQDDLVLAVRNGLIDAAFIRTGLLENMQREGKLKIDDFEIVDRHNSDGFPLVYSTELYPEWCLTALPGADPGDADKITRAALGLTPDMAPAARARINGFVEPVSLDGIKQALKALQIVPYSG